jgi:hypothetical protein
MSTEYQRLIPDYSKHRARLVGGMRSKPAAERSAESTRRSHDLGAREMGEKEFA